MMTDFLKKHAEMTNAEFEKKLRQECEKCETKINQNVQKRQT